MSKIDEWRKLSADLKEIKKKEMALRREICEQMLEEEGAPPCRKKVEIVGLKIEASQTVSHNIDEAALQSMVDDLSLEEKNVLKYKPSLMLRQYKKLPKDSILHDAVIVKPNAPTLKVTDI